MKKFLFGLVGLIILFSLVITASSPAKASPATIYVPDNYPTIQAAVNAASPGDTIIVRNGTYTENVDVSKSLTIQSENGAEVTIVQSANPNDHIFQVTADNVSIIGFTIEGTTADQKAEVFLVSVDGCNVRNNTILSNCTGIHLFCSNNNTLTGNSLFNNSYDESLSSCKISVYHSSGNTINNNSCQGSEMGIWVCWSSSNNIANNSVSGNKNGISIWDSINNVMTENAIESNDTGITILSQAGGSTYSNVVADNMITGNRYGIALVSFANFLVVDNVIKNNVVSHGKTGIFVRGLYCKGNHIYLNDFMSSTMNVDFSSATNIWNSPEQITYTYNGRKCTNYLGNYWSDYSGSDANGDGIGETPYPIDSDSDNYPLMELFENYAIGAVPTVPDKASSLAKAVLGAAYLWGGKGWDWELNRFVDAADIMAGYRYNWSVNGIWPEKKAGVDCSGLVFWAYNKAYGATKYLDEQNPVQYQGADGQYKNNTENVDESNLIPGDLLFFDFVLNSDYTTPKKDDLWIMWRCMLGPSNLEASIMTPSMLRREWVASWLTLRTD